MEPLSTKKSQQDSNIGKLSRLSSITEDMKPQIWENFPKNLYLRLCLQDFPLPQFSAFTLYVGNGITCYALKVFIGIVLKSHKQIHGFMQLSEIIMEPSTTLL
ncbi:hypothetical protein P8452_39079 [Trifolium repens]|nr:hypothetical protein P8452_39079 [Trifolium repens]